MSVLDKFVSKEATLSMPIATYQVLLEQAALEERERIIKLLEKQIARLQEQIDKADPDQSWDIGYWQGDIDIITMSIALIKGENK